jgi:hypothetical protein
MRHNLHISKTELAKALAQQIFENLLVIAIAVIVVFTWSRCFND